MSNLQNLAHNSAYALEMEGRSSATADAPLRKRDRWKSRPTFLIARCARLKNWCRRANAQHGILRGRSLRSHVDLPTCIKRAPTCSCMGMVHSAAH